MSRMQVLTDVEREKCYFMTVDSRLCHCSIFYVLESQQHCEGQ